MRSALIAIVFTLFEQPMGAHEYERARVYITQNDIMSPLWRFLARQLPKAAI